MNVFVLAVEQHETKITFGTVAFVRDAARFATPITSGTVVSAQSVRLYAMWNTTWVRAAASAAAEKKGRSLMTLIHTKTSYRIGAVTT